MSYKNSFNAHKRLWREFYGSDTEQYSYLPHYLELLREHGNKTDISLTQIGNNDKKFDKIVIVFREGVEAFKEYSACGLAVDGTFLKTSVGGVLLVACFRNGNGDL